MLMYVIEGRYLPDEIPARWRDALESALDEHTARAVRKSFSLLSSGDLVTIAYFPRRGVAMSVNGRVIAQTSGHRVVDAVVQAWAFGAPLTKKLERLALEHPC
jgi:hypothetical protein